MAKVIYLNSLFKEQKPNKKAIELINKAIIEANGINPKAQPKKKATVAKRKPAAKKAPAKQKAPKKRRAKKATPKSEEE